MKVTLTKDQIQGMIREIFAFIGALLAVYGYSQIGGINAPDVIGTIMWASFMIWGIIDKTNTDKSAIASVFRKLLSMGAAIIVYYFPTTQKVVAVGLPTIMGIIAILFSNGDNAPTPQTKI